MTTEEIDKLFANTLLGNYDDDAPWAAVSQIQSNGNRYIFEKADEWCRSHDPKFRSRSANILCQLRDPRAPKHDQNTSSEPIFVEDSFNTLARMVLGETDDDALSSELFGLGHLYKPEAVPILVQYSGHRNEDVRFAVACSLGHFCQDPLSLEHLVRLADDPDSDVRNWALFALGSQSEFDSKEIRDLFASHLDDPDPDSREEAVAGLAKRKDSRAAQPLLQLMLAGSYFSHHDLDFKALVEASDDADWGTEDFVDALYERFQELLPPREKTANNPPSSSSR
jgi:HEAT repeat protein